MTPVDVFAYVVAGFLGLAVGIVLLGVFCGAAYLVGSALLRRIAR